MSRCVSCGDIVPEGRQVCWACEHGNTPEVRKKENKKMMKIDSVKEYQELAARTQNKEKSWKDREYHALHGMVGEIGEIHSIYQKAYQGHQKDYEGLMKEVGDLCWFIAEYCDCRGWELSDVMGANIEKLKKRYPEGFTEERSVNRAEYEKEG